MRKLIKSPLTWYVSILLLIIILVVSSSQGSETSNGYSIQIAEKIYARLPWLFHQAGAPDEYELILGINFVIRKIAHFSIFVLLTVFLLFATRQIRINRILHYFLIFIAVTLIAGADEMHQIFSGRNATFFDVLIDICGVIFTYCIAGFVIFFRKKNKHANKD